jgi:hypothetical protein
MTEQSQAVMIEITSPNEIPALASEDEEHRFWSSHCIGRAYLDRVGSWTPESTLPTQLPPKRKRTTSAKRPQV